MWPSGHLHNSGHAPFGLRASRSRTRWRAGRDIGNVVISATCRGQAQATEGKVVSTPREEVEREGRERL